MSGDGGNILFFFWYTKEIDIILSGIKKGKFSWLDFEIRQFLRLNNNKEQLGSGDNKLNC